MTMVHLVITFTIGGIAILNAVLFWFMPRLTRRDLYFAVTVAPAFRDEPEGRSILGRYRAELIFFSALALAAFVAGTARLCVGFVSTGTFLQLVASFIAFYRARQRVLPHAVAPTSLVPSQNAVAVRRGLPPVRGLVRAMTNAGRLVLPARLLPRAAVLGADYRGGRDGGEGFTQRSLQCCPGSHATDQWA